MDTKERRLEIALEFRKFGIATDNISAFKFADDFLEASGIEHKSQGYSVLFETPEALEERTKNRVAKLFEYGFEWNEDRSRYESNGNYIAHNSVTTYSEEQFDMFFNEHMTKDTYLESPVEVAEEHFPMPTKSIDIVNSVLNENVDLFKGKTYIEFEMANSMARIYKIENINEAEHDLSPKKGEPKYIMTSSENKEHGLGLTIFKK